MPLHASTRAYRYFWMAFREHLTKQSILTRSWMLTWLLISMSRQRPLSNVFRIGECRRFGDLIWPLSRLRLSRRFGDSSWIHPASGRVYSYSYKPPKLKGKDDITGEPLVQRDDDKPECIRNRLASYDEVRSWCAMRLVLKSLMSTDHGTQQVTSPLVHYYQEKGVLESFQGTESDKIYPNVKMWLEKKELSR